LKYLLDTHVFLWAAFSPERLSASARELLLDTGRDVVVSGITFWEIALKAGLGKLSLEGCSPEDLPDAARNMGFGILLPEAADMASFGRLPRAGPKDPFDRMIVWQSIRTSRTLITRDGTLDPYREHGLSTIW
jgi:PIN domain nuclease of toxin-antitoxin system